jgi:trimeric autotransporter adhesin
MTILHLKKSIGWSPLRLGFLLIQLVLAWLALSQTAQAVTPAPDGGYPNANTAEGTNALFSLTTGTGNTGNGSATLYHDTAGSGNTASGASALFGNTTGGNNTANGGQALYKNTTGGNNTATGVSALYSNTTGTKNTATGVNALYSNTIGGNNTATGFDALARNTTGLYDTANGAYALLSNTTGEYNTANGAYALYSNTTGGFNTANGFSALQSNTVGSSNTANGYAALVNNTTGTENTGEGFHALLHNTGSNNIGLGSNAGSSLTTGSGNVCIGAGILGVAGESNTTRIRNVYASVASGRAVYVNSDNKIGTLASSRRFKEEIKPMDKASEAILALKPVTFRYKKEIEPNGAIMFGLIAEEVEKVDPDLVTRDAKGEAETVRYEAVNAMLLNEFLKEHRTVEEQGRKAQEQEATIAQLKKDFRATVAQLIARLEEQASQIQKVSAQIEVTKPAPQVVNNNQ